MLHLELSGTMIFPMQNHQSSCTKTGIPRFSFCQWTWSIDALLSAWRKTAKGCLFNTQESGLMVMGAAVLQVRFACHLDLFNWHWSNLFPLGLSLLTPELGKGWQSWAVCTSQLGGEPSSSPGDQHHHICCLQCWAPRECSCQQSSSFLP